MKYKNIKKAKFISRPNRFIAKVDIDGEEVTVHVKNTGRCKELLLPGCTVYLEKADNPDRKTPYDLVAVEHDDSIINIDSQAPNVVVREWLLRQGQYSLVKPEYKYGDSRIDFYMEKGQEKYLMGILSEEMKLLLLFRIYTLIRKMFLFLEEVLKELLEKVKTIFSYMRLLIMR